jgi:methyl-accepting chemotaxis protein
MLSIKARIGAIALVPILGLLGFASLSVADKWSQYSQGIRLESDALTAVAVGEVAHRLQVERGMSGAFLGSGGGNGVQLEEQRVAVDTALADLRASLAQSRAEARDPDLAVHTAKLIDDFTALAELRDAVSNQSIAAAESARRYTALIGSAENVVAYVARVGAELDPEIGRALTMYAAIGSGKEQIGRARAFGVNLLNAERIDPAGIARLTQFAGAEQAEFAMAGRVVLPQHAQSWEALLASPQAQRLEEMRADILAASGGAPPLAPQAWFADVTAFMDVLRALQVDIAADAGAMVKAKIASEMMLLVIGVLLSLAAIGAAIGAALLVSRSIIKPMNVLAGEMNALAAGDKSIEAAASKRTDELGGMGVALLHFRDAAIEKDRLEAEAARQRAAAEAERARNEAAQRAAQAEQAHVVSALAEGLSAMAHGDLTCRLTEDFPGEYRKLQDDFNAAIAQLMETMRVIAESSQGIRSGAGEISHAADDLARRTEQQAAGLEETAAALDQITATVNRTAEGSRQAHAAVATARADAEKGGDVMRGAVSAMEAIEKSAGQISRIISVIDEIAFQTNLLALNAGVEAARAGDAGRGFAVVASEVRALAQRSAEAAKEIKGLISTSNGQVASGVRLVGDTGEALERIVARVAEINTLVSEIAGSAQEQATGLSQVNTAVNQMDQATQQNAAMVEQSTAASHSLAHEADELAALVAKFNIGAQAAAQPAQRARVARRA